MKSPEELKRLIQQATQGDDAAFSNLYLHYLTPIYRFVYFRVRSKEDAEDLTQHIFTKAWAALAEFEYEEHSFSAWLYRIARNATIDYWRKKKYVVLDPAAPMFHNRRDDSILPDKAAEQKEETQLIRETLHILQEDQQTVLTLKFIEGLSSKEISQIMGKSDGAIRQIQSRALKALRQHFKENDIL